MSLLRIPGIPISPNNKLNASLLLDSFLAYDAMTNCFLFCLLKGRVPETRNKSVDTWYLTHFACHCIDFAEFLLLLDMTTILKKVCEILLQKEEKHPIVVWKDKLLSLSLETILRLLSSTSKEQLINSALILRARKIQWTNIYRYYIAALLSALLMPCELSLNFFPGAQDECWNYPLLFEILSR